MAAMTVPEGVKQIYPSAFRGVGSLTKIDLPGSLEAINDAAFRGCPNIVTIKCEAANPPVVEDAFDAAVTGKVTVIVPNASLDMYQSADCWRSFGQIVGGQ
jgi:regulator of RNase E activity RraA